jgi:hypothetical protein
VGLALSDALKLPSFDDVHLPEDASEGADADLPLEPPKMKPNTTSRRIRAYGVSARRSVRSDGICANKPEMKEAKESDVTASTKAQNPLDALPDVFDNLQTLLDDLPQMEDGPKESNEAVLQRETTKGQIDDPIDLTDRDYRLFLRKPADAVAVGLGKFYFVGTSVLVTRHTSCISQKQTGSSHLSLPPGTVTVEDADEAYDEIIQSSTSIVTKATYKLFGANGTWYRG